MHTCIDLTETWQMNFKQDKEWDEISSSYTQFKGRSAFTYLCVF